MIASVLLALTFFQSPPNPEALVLQVGGSVWDVAVTDLNGDKAKEILALTNDQTDEGTQKSLHVFLATAGGTYDTKPAHTLNLSPDVGALFLAEVDGAAPRELVAVDAMGAIVYAFADGAFSEVAAPRFTSLFATGTNEPVFLKKVAKDITGDGRDEWFVPVPVGYELRTAEEKLATVRCDLVSEYRGVTDISIYHRLPSIHAFKPDDGAEQSSLAFLSDEYADFSYGDGWSEAVRFKVPANLEEKWEASTRMDDVNGDDLPDLVVSQTKGTAQIQVLTQVYVAEAPYTYPDEPTNTFEASGAIATPYIRDVDGDEKLDLILIQVPFGVKAIWNFFVRNKIVVQAKVYLYKEDGYGAKPDFDQEVTLDAPEGREQVAYNMGDFNGDGRLDVAFGISKDELIIRLGSDKTFLTQKPWTRISTPTFGFARPFKLNDNMNDDLIIYHPGIENKERIEVILF
jgi:hypothetical protein